MRLKERDERLFRFLYKFKYATIDQITEYLNISKNSMYRRLAQLQRGRGKYIESTSRDENGIYFEFNRKYYSNGAMAREHMGNFEDEVKVVSIELEHNSTVVNIYLKLLEWGFNEYYIFSKREIYKYKIEIEDEKFYEFLQCYVPKAKESLCKVPDLTIRAEKENRFTAIEIKLSERDIKESINSYLNTEYAKVIYLCKNNTIKKRIDKIIEDNEKLNFIKTYMIDDLQKEDILDNENMYKEIRKLIYTELENYEIHNNIYNVVEQVLMKNKEIENIEYAKILEIILEIIDKQVKSGFIRKQKP